MNNPLYDLKIRFDGAITELGSYLPLIQLMSYMSHENNNKNGFGFFVDTVKEISTKSINYMTSKYSIESIVGDAKLYLAQDELLRFSVYAKKAIEFRNMSLENLLENLNRILLLPKNEIAKTPLGFATDLERAFVNNYDGGWTLLPIAQSLPNENFPIELANGIKKYFILFEDSVNKMIDPIEEKQHTLLTQNDTSKIASKLTNLQAIGYLFTELIEKGIMQPKRKAGKYSPTNTAKLILEHFHFEDLEEQPTPEDIRKTLSNDNRLSSDKMQLFKIPTAKQLNEK